ncbi:MAG: PIN domain-containing protein, partial [Bifidobacteriaceae bacterium]|nr:PIN domain-containing protein [Bifidobacteriaceae bacterium]
TPAAVLAELYRGGGHDQSLDAFLARYPGVQVVDTDRTLAKLVGHILAAAHRTSADHVDATVVATAALHGRSIILTSDPDDITALVHDHPKIIVEALTD